MIKLYRSTDVGAPTLTRTAGALVALFDAVLVNGFNRKSVSGIQRDGQTATVITRGDHGYTVGQAIYIEGADPAEYNGEFAVLTVPQPDRFTVQLNAAPVIDASGTINVKRAPVGWLRPFGNDTRAVYQPPPDYGLNRPFYRVGDDGDGGAGGATDFLWASFSMFETMSDVNTGTGQCPWPDKHKLGSGGQAAGLLYKSNGEPGVGSQWFLLSDGYTVYFFNNWYSYSQVSYLDQPMLYAFGRFASHLPGDAWANWISYEFSTQSSPAAYNYLVRSFNGSASGTVYQRTWQGLAHNDNSRDVRLYTPFPSGSGSGYDGRTPRAHPANGRVYHAPILLYEQMTYGDSWAIEVRGEAPGLRYLCHTRPFTYWQPVSLQGRQYLPVPVGISGYAGQLLIDLTGPWEVSAWAG